MMRPMTLPLEDAVRQHLDHLSVERALSRNTIQAYASDLRALLRLVGRGVDVRSVGLEALTSLMTANVRRGLGARSAARQLSALRSFFRFALRERWIDSDPTTLVDRPRVRRALPRVLGFEDVRRLLEAPRLETDRGRLHMAMLHVLYSSGLRVSELCTLRVADLDVEREVLLVAGKGGKGRCVPIGEVALDHVVEYLRTVRPKQPRAAMTTWLFLSPRGDRFARESVWRMVQRYARRIGIRPSPSPHTLRHSFATSVLRGGADLRILQEMLGHADLATTEIYTHLTLDDLRRVHAASHPRCRRVAR